MANLAIVPTFAGYATGTVSAAAKNGNGGLGLVVVAVLAVVMYFLFRSMVKHLRKAQQMKADPVADERSPGAPRDAGHPVDAADPTTEVPRPRR